MSRPLVSINLVVLNGEKYISYCLDSLLKQTYPQDQIEINILDNGSTDTTISTIENWKLKNENFKTTFIKSSHNHGMWGGQEELLKYSSGKYIVVLSSDVILEKNFISNSVTLMESDPKIAAVQGKILQFHVGSTGPTLTEIIDTCGFKVFHSRKVVNIGHGEKDSGQHNNQREIFGAEGAVPVIRREALDSIKILGEIADHDLFWYAEDLDVAWRLHLAGWKQYYEPSVIAWHDRQTTKRTRSGFIDFIKLRRAIPLKKRRLEWRNIRCTIIKNDYIINLLKDLPYIAPREIAMFVYLLIFETPVLTEVFGLLKMAPRMLSKRKVILGQAKIGRTEIYSYFS